MVFSQGQLAPSFRGRLAISGDVLGQRLGCLLASSGKRPAKLLDILQVQDGPAAKDVPAPHVSRAEAERP